MSSPTVRLHVGLMKSGTTSVQTAVAAARSQLMAHGVHYPDLGQANQMLSFVEILESDPAAISRMPPGLRRHHAETRRSWGGMFQRMCSTVETVDAPVVLLSAENLIYGAPTAIRMLRERLALRRVEVVVTHRRPRALIPSNYQQQARIQALPPFEEWTRRELGKVLVGREDCSLASISMRRFRATLIDVADEVTLVDTHGDASESLEAMWSVLTGGMLPPPQSDAVVANRSLPVEFVDGLQIFLRQKPSRTVAEVRSVVAVAAARYVAQVPTRAYVRELTPSFADSIDQALAPDGDASAFDQALDRLRSSEPLTQTRAVGLPPAGYDDLRTEALQLLHTADRRLAFQRLIRPQRARIRRVWK